MIKDLVVTYANNIAAVTDEYWLRIEQVAEEAAITTEEASTFVDSLYDINPCIEETAESTEEAEVTQEKLYSTAVDVFGDDLETCRSELAGDYVAEVKVWQSHLLESYKLELSAGEVIETVRIFENLSLDLDIKDQSSIDLEYPVTSAIAVAWIGTILGTENPPEITLTGSVLSWGTLLTGTIRAEFTTAYDLVTISVPGVPKFEGAEIGDTQSVKILGFFHRMVFIGEISPPEDDTTVTNGALVQLCGFLKSGELGEVEPPEEEPTPEEAPEYGCIDFRALWTDPFFYEEKCCVPPDGIPNGCVVRTSRNPGGVSISREDIEKYTLKKGILGLDPVTEFIPVGPTDPKGCGTIYWNTILTPLNCCVDVEPFESSWYPLELSPTGYVLITVEGDLGPLRWSVAPPFKLEHEFTGTPGHNTLTASSTEICEDIEDAVVRVKGVCNETVVLIPLINFPPPDPLIFGNVPDSGFYTMAQDTLLGVLAVGGVRPYMWQTTGGISVIDISDVGTATIKSSPDFCGMGSITVTDKCGEVVTVGVRSTAGVWKQVQEFDRCSGNYIAASPFDGMNPVTAYSTDGKHKAIVALGFSAQSPVCQYPGEPVCPLGTDLVIGWYDYLCIPGFYNGQCCEFDGPIYQPIFQYINALWIWECEE